MDLPFESFVLDNGLRVIVHEDRSLPIVAVNLWYHVGARDEAPGLTGLAHLFEHLMFEGSAHVAEGEFDELLEAAGAINNGSTTHDRTNYWSVLPSNALELALWLEADRMGWLLPAMTAEKLDTQRDVVKNERRQSYENRPYGLAWEHLQAGLYPPEHPYRHPVIGSMEHLDAATLDDAREFFRSFYAPDNASLAVAGDVSATDVHRLAERYFAGIPRGVDVPRRPAPAAALERERRLVLEDAVRLPRLYLAWHSPAFFAPGDAALDAAARVLAGSKASRLHRRLVDDLELAQDVDAYQNSGLLGSSFVIAATARPDVPLTAIRHEVHAQLAALARDGIRARELERAVNRIETDLVDALQDLAGRADRLNLYAFYRDDPGYAAGDVQRFRRLSPADVRDAVLRFTVRAPGVALSVVPRGRPELAADGAS